MLQNYLKTALRNLWREKSSSVLNLTGLTLGIGASLILFLLIRYQNSFDTFHQHRESIYRVNSQSKGNNGYDYTPGVPSLLPEAFRLDFPEAEEVTFTSYRSGGLVTIPQTQGEPKKYEEKRGIVYAQPTFFRIFDRKVLIGNAEKGIDEPHEAIISRSLATKYFGKEDAIGEILKYNRVEYKVTAIMEDPPPNTDLPFSLMLSYATIKKELDDHGWNSTWSDEHCYFKLRDGARVVEMESRMPAFVKKYLGNDNRDDRTFVLQPLKEIHFDDRFGNYNYQIVSSNMLMALTVIAIFLLATACINFINLATAEAIKRSKEVGIRKSLGSTRNQLIAQFLFESSLVTIGATLLALLLTQLILPLVNSFLNLQLSMEFIDLELWSYVLGMVVLVSLFSGFYPSFVVSSFSPILALKNKMGNQGSSGFNLRRSLVILQFGISQLLVIATLVIIVQMNYFRGKDLGFRKDAVITVPIPRMVSSADSSRSTRMKTLRNELMRLGGVERASLNNSPPSSGSVSGTGFTMEGEDTFYDTQVKTIDGNYLDLFELPLVAGTNLLDLDTAQGFLVNERLASLAGFASPQDIVGKRIKMWRKTLPVVGVLKNFHTVSLHRPIEPTILLNRISNYGSMSIRINPMDMQGTIREIEKKWVATYPELVFSYEFLDQSIREFYETEERTAVLLSVFTSLAILIGCLGLFGLASFMANQKMKEIGIRKVLGATVESILLLFSREFGLLILLGFVLATPIAWFGMSRYLNDFAYKIELGPGIFLSGLGMTLFVAAITVGYRSIRAATVNPVDSLRSE